MKQLQNQHEKLSVMSEKEHREGLFKELKSVIKLTHKKFHRRRQKDEGVQIRWGNLLLKTIDSYGHLLETDERDLRILKLEEQFKDGVVIPKNEER